MADLVTRLKLDDKQFNDNIKKSKQQMQQFQNAGKAVATSLKTFTIALVGVQTAAEAFNKLIRSSQGISDEYDKVMRGVTTSVDEFFTALSTGDFTTFQMGLSGIITKAREAQAALDKLGNATMSYSYFDSKYSAELEDAINKAKDLKLSQAERDAAKITAQTIIGKQEEITKELSKSIKNALSNVMTEGNLLDASSVGKVDLEDILLLDITAKGEENKNKLAALYEEYKKIAIQKEKEFTTRHVDVTADGARVFIDEVDKDGYLRAMQPINQQYKQAILYNEILVKKGDDWLQNTITMAQQLDNSNRKLTEMKNKMLEISNQDISKVTNTTIKIEPEMPEGSLAQIEQEIADTKAKIKIATDNRTRTILYNQLKALEEKKRIIEFKYKFPKPEDLNYKPSDLSQPLSTEELAKIKLPKFESPIKKEDVDINQQYADSLNAVANIMGSISNVTKEGAAAWLTWGANLLTSIAAAIPAIQTMVAAKTAEGAASAGAEAAKTPFIGWLLVGGAIAAALAAFASIPGFSDGGIFQSPFTTGDKNLARLNGGEMILNKGQQSNLFNLLDKGGNLGGGNVTFKIEGKQLVGVLNNYNNKRSKVL